MANPLYLTRGPLTARYRVSPDANFSDDKSLSRHDLAHFLRQEAEQARYVRRMVALSD